MSDDGIGSLNGLVLFAAVSGVAIYRCREREAKTKEQEQLKLLRPNSFRYKQAIVDSFDGDFTEVSDEVSGCSKTVVQQVTSAAIEPRAPFLRVLNRRASMPGPSLLACANRGDDIDGRLVEDFSIPTVRVHDLTSLCDKFPSANIRNGKSALYNKVEGNDEDYILADIVRNAKKTTGQSTDAFVRGGPREVTHFDPSKVRAAIVTCGGLCPGLNNVIRELVDSLYRLYNVEEVLGVIGGYHGFREEEGYESMILTPELVSDCHHQGGTILASSRGGFVLEDIIGYLTRNRIDQLYVIGGDGTHRGAHKIAQEVITRNMNVSVVGIPKTIDNDVDLIDRSFGFTTSVEAAQEAIKSAKTEARCNLPNGIGIVKLMGRSAGFIAAYATLSSGDVDLCLVPEFHIELEGANGILPFLLRKVKQQKHAVVVVAEGAGEELLGKSEEKDASGNRKLPPIGEFLKTKVTEFFKKNGLEATVKYIDPSYMIRSVPANASDALYCLLLAQNAAHGAMAGYTGFTVGLVNNRIVFIPIPRLVATSPRVLDPLGHTWERVRAMTQQPQGNPSFDPSNATVRSY